VVQAGVVIFFVLVPIVAAYQSGRASALVLPIGLVLVSAEWVVVSDGGGLSVVGLGAALIGLAMAAYTLWRFRSTRR
jgi:hypothetical protein